jgi:hypothetical protein
MSERLPLPRLIGAAKSGELTGSSAGAWLTYDGRFTLVRTVNRPHRWLVCGVPDQAEAWIEAAGLAWQGFDTRREALEALALALHLDADEGATRPGGP